MVTKKPTQAEIKAANAAKRKASLAVLQKKANKKTAAEMAAVKRAKDPNMKSGLGKGGGNKGGAFSPNAKQSTNKAMAYNPKNKGTKNR